MAIIELDQTLDTPLTNYRRGNFMLRYAYARSKDAKLENLRGEDYLVFRVKPTCLAFALCDGVGGSFYGGLAAQIVGEILVQWLWSDPTKQLMESLDSSLILHVLNQHLDNQVRFASDFVNKKDLSGLTNQFVKGSYEEKKLKAGSQSNFVCGLVNAPTKQNPTGSVWLFWLGDAKLKTWKGTKNKTDALDAAFESEQSWSSNDGVRGKIYVFHTNITEVDFIIAHTDGLNPIEQHLKPKMNSSIIDTAIMKLQDSTNSDDISYLEIKINDQIINSPDDLVEDLRERLYFSPRVQISQTTQQPEIEIANHELKTQNVLSSGDEFPKLNQSPSSGDLGLEKPPLFVNNGKETQVIKATADSAKGEKVGGWLKHYILGPIDAIARILKRH